MCSARLQGQLHQEQIRAGSPCGVIELREEDQGRAESSPRGTEASERVCSGGWLGVLCVLKDGSGGPDAYGPQLCSRGTLKWPDGRNHVGEFCQGLEHG